MHFHHPAPAPALPFVPVSRSTRRSTPSCRVVWVRNGPGATADVDRLEHEGASPQGDDLMPDGAGFSLVFSRALGKVIVHIHGALDADTAPALKARLGDI